MFKATALVYSSHNRSEYIHRDWIVERALQSHHNKTIFLIPMSMGKYDQQHYSWGTFEWFFNRFKKWGLEPSTFFWNDHLSHEDVDLFFDQLVNSEVVILGGGSSILGMDRYQSLGERYYGDRHLFSRILHERQNKGKLTVGFSAGADQLCQYIAGGYDFDDEEEQRGFGLVRNTTVSLHHEWGREGDLRHMARSFPHCMVYGLPNDSGIASDQGFLPSGNIWQVSEFIVDNTWDLPKDGFHIKTRQGMKVEHYYNDGRHWSFDDGDMMVRVMSPDNRYQDAWIVQKGRGIFDYWTQEWSGYHRVEDILASH
jgi:peptidase E